MPKACGAPAPAVEDERVTGIEPASPAWKAGALPLSYTRGARETLPGPRPRAASVTTVARSAVVVTLGAAEVGLVGAGGFEPPTSCSQSKRANQAAPRPAALQPAQSLSCFPPASPMHLPCSRGIGVPWQRLRCVANDKGCRAAQTRAYRKWVTFRSWVGLPALRLLEPEERGRSEERRVSDWESRAVIPTFVRLARFVAPNLSLASRIGKSQTGTARSTHRGAFSPVCVTRAEGPRFASPSTTRMNRL